MASTAPLVGTTGHSGLGGSNASHLLADVDTSTAACGRRLADVYQLVEGADLSIAVTCRSCQKAR